MTNSTDKPEAVTSTTPDGVTDGTAAAAPTEDPALQNRVSLAELYKYADGTDKLLLAVGCVFAFANGASMPAFSEIFGRLINELSSGATNIEERVTFFALIMLYVGLGVMFLSAVQTMCFMCTSQRQISRIKERFFASALKQEAAWHDEHKPGELTSRVSGDTKVIINGMNDKIGTGLIYNLGTFLFGYGFGFYRSWRLTLVMMGTLPLLAVTGILMAKMLAKLSDASRTGFARAGNVAEEAFQNVRTVQTFRSEEREAGRFDGELEPARAAGVKGQFGAMMGVGVSYGIIFSSYSLAFWFSSYLVEWGVNNVGEIMAVFFSVLIGSFGAGLIFPALGDLAQAQGAAFKVFAIIDRVPLIRTPDESAQKMAELKGELAFRDVSFSYPTRREQKLFTKLNVVIKPGTTVAFSGASGCGKSSIVALLQRFYDPDQGQVTVDGVDMKTLDLDWWRDQVGIVSQEPNLFMGSILENVRVGKPSATLEEVETACRMANIHDTILTLPQKYDTPVGAVGSQLSGGQKQRIAIARAMLKNPSILILDEATSALDRKSEAEVQAALDKIMSGVSIGPDGKEILPDDDIITTTEAATAEGIVAPSPRKRTAGRRTVVVIAHRLTTIRNASTIHFITYDELEGSKVAESGSFDELVAQNGLFAQMVSKQNISMSDEDPAAAANAVDEDADEADDKTSAVRATSDAHLGNDSFSKRQESTVNAGGGNNSSLTGGNATTGTIVVAVGAEKAKPKSVKELADEEVKNIVVPRSRLAALAEGEGWSVFIGILGSIISGALYPAYSIVLSNMLNVLAQSSPQQVREKTPMWAGLFLAIGGAAFTGWTLQAFYSIAGQRLTMRLRGQLFKALMYKDQTFFDTPGRDSGALNGMISGDCESVAQLYGPALGMKIQMFVNLAAGIIIGMIYSWKIALVTMATMPFMIVTGALQQAMLLGFTTGEEASGGSLFSESFTNIRTILAFNMQCERLGVFEAMSAVTRKEGIKTGIICGGIFGLTQFSFYGVFALSFWYGGTLLQKGEVKFVDVMTATFAVLMSAMGAGEAGGAGAKVQDADQAAKRVFAAMDNIPAIDMSKQAGKKLLGDVPLEDVSATATGTTEPMHRDSACRRTVPIDIKFEKVSFTYPSRPGVRVLKRFTTHIPFGDSIGLMGSTGCGKSTIIQLLARFYPQTHGRILINDVPIEEYDLRSWRQHMSIVLQEPNLFSGSVLENIRYSRPSATMDECVEAAKAACIHDDILAMTAGYQTEVGFKGKMLSGGQKQRVAIARALLCQPSLLLMDEATSALDNNTESNVMRGINDFILRMKQRQDGQPQPPSAAASGGGKTEEDPAAAVKAVDTSAPSPTASSKGRSQHLGGGGGGLTSVSVAHRLTTIRDSSKIVLLDQGVVLEQGTHDDLMARNGEYKKRYEHYMASAS